MREIADLYKDEGEMQKYQNAAARFRLPFWDPFMPRNIIEKTAKLKETIFGVPQILRKKTVFVKHWNSTELEEMANPLESFFFPSEETLVSKGRTTWSESDWTIETEDGDYPRVVRIDGFYYTCGRSTC